MAREESTSLPNGFISSDSVSSSVMASRRGDVLLLQLNSPDGFPRLTRAVLGELGREIAAFVVSAAFRGTVITGTDKCFCAGAELTEVATLNGTKALKFSVLGQSLMSAIERSSKPIIAAIRGYCMGGGFDLALACHMRIATADAVFAHRGAALGIITGWGGTQRMPRVLGPRGRAMAQEVMTTGREVSAAEAYDLRLISRIVAAEELIEEACAMAAGRQHLRD